MSRSQLSRIFIANCLGIISVLGPGGKVDAQVSKGDNLWAIVPGDFSSANISQIAAAKITEIPATSVDKMQIAQTHWDHGRTHWREGLEKFLEKLDLSEEQSRQIKSIYRRYYQTNQQARQQLKEAREQIGWLLTSETNSYRLRQKHRQIQSLEQQLGDSRFEALLEVRAVLTPQQRKEIAQMIAKYRHRRSYHHHHHKKSD